MTAHAATNAEIEELERNLAEEIARAMQRQPLMERLAGLAPTGRIRRETEDGAGDAGAAAIDLLMEDLGEPVTTPASTAEWVGKARRERNRARLGNAVAWLATLVIGCAIISATVLLLPR